MVWVLYGVGSMGMIIGCAKKGVILSLLRYVYILITLSIYCVSGYLESGLPGDVDNKRLYLLLWSYPEHTLLCFRLAVLGHRTW